MTGEFFQTASQPGSVVKQKQSPSSSRSSHLTFATSLHPPCTVRRWPARPDQRSCCLGATAMHHHSALTCFWAELWESKKRLRGAEVVLERRKEGRKEGLHSIYRLPQVQQRWNKQLWMGWSPLQSFSVVRLPNVTCPHTWANTFKKCNPLPSSVFASHPHSAE